MLNGELLRARSDGTLPLLKPKVVVGPITIPPSSIAFLQPLPSRRDRSLLGSANKDSARAMCVAHADKGSKLKNGAQSLS
eukprot:scaffold65717_cov34-Tisochrysis_lutea.AAC.2